MISAAAGPAFHVWHIKSDASSHPGAFRCGQQTAQYQQQAGIAADHLLLAPKHEPKRSIKSTMLQVWQDAQDHTAF
jgi:hypothetical protein